MDERLFAWRVTRRTIHVARLASQHLESGEITDATPIVGILWLAASSRAGVSTRTGVPEPPGWTASVPPARAPPAPPG